MSSNHMSDGKLVIISGPSGVGKSTICSRVIEKMKNAHLIVSATTRPAAKSERNGLNYWFISRPEFEKRMAAGEFIESAEVFGNLYGTPRDKLEEAMEQGKTVILEIDVQGALQVKRKFPKAKMIFIVPPKSAELQRRINGRGRDHADEIEKRLDMASSEIALAWQHYKHMVINDDLQAAVDEVIQIINKPDGE